MPDNKQRQHGGSTKDNREQQNQQGSGYGGQKRGGEYAERIEREGEAKQTGGGKGDHRQGGKNNEQGRHTDKGEGL